MPLCTAFKQRFFPLSTHLFTHNARRLLSRPHSKTQIFKIRKSAAKLSRALVGIKITQMCSWSIARRRCPNCIFILDLTPGFNRLGNDNCKMRRETFQFAVFGGSYIRGLTVCITGLRGWCSPGQYARTHGHSRQSRQGEKRTLRVPTFRPENICWEREVSGLSFPSWWRHHMEIF